MGTSLFFRLGLGLLLCGLGSTAEAAWYSCPRFIVQMFWGESSPRVTDQAMLEESIRLEAQATVLQGMTGRHLSATQMATRNISQIIDHYLLLGDIGPLINLYQGNVRKTELAYLQRMQNLAIIETLKSQKKQVSEKTEIESALRTALLSDWEGNGLLTPEKSSSLATASVALTLTWIQNTITILEKEIRAHEMMMGREFEEWKQVRKHLATIIEGANSYLLERVEAVDGRTPMATRSMVGLESVVVEEEAKGEPGEQLRELLRARETQIKSRIEAITDGITTVETWLGKVEDTTHPLSFPELQEFLTTAKYLNDNLRSIVAKGSLAESDKVILISELELLRNRLRDAREMVDYAFKLDRVLGIHSGDFATYGRLVPQYSLRPTIDDFAKVVYNSRVSQRARLRREKWRAVWSFIDGNLLYGKIGALIPTLGRGTENMHMPFLRNFIYLLCKDLYLQHAENQYFPALTLLRNTRGDAQKLLRQLENLNAGTKDELLNVFVRRADLSTLWKTIKAQALAIKEGDHLNLHDRMVKAEKTGLELGTISLITSGSYTRYVVAGILNGSIVYVAGQWWIVPTAKSVWTSIFGAIDPPISKSWLNILTSWIFPEAHAAPDERAGWILLTDYSEEVEEGILSDMELVVAGLTKQKVVTPSAFERAAQRLFDLEKKFSKMTDHQLVNERCPKCAY